MEGHVKTLSKLRTARMSQYTEPRAGYTETYVNRCIEVSMASSPAELTLGRYSQHVSRWKGRESPMVECLLSRTMVRKSYLPQHLCKEQGNRGILNFAARAKLIVEENLMSYFLEMVGARDLYQRSADSYYRVSDS